MICTCSPKDMYWNIHSKMIIYSQKSITTQMCTNNKILTQQWEWMIYNYGKLCKNKHNAEQKTNIMLLVHTVYFYLYNTQKKLIYGISEQWLIWGKSKDTDWVLANGGFLGCSQDSLIIRVLTTCVFWENICTLFCI